MSVRAIPLLVLAFLLYNAIVLTLGVDSLQKEIFKIHLLSGGDWTFTWGDFILLVTLILLFVFVSPYFINYNDKPIARKPHPTEVVVTADAEGHLIYQVAATAITPGDDHSVRDQLLRVIEPISGAISIVSYEPVADGKGQVQSYRVQAKRD